MRMKLVADASYIVFDPTKHLICKQLFLEDIAKGWFIDLATSLSPQHQIYAEGSEYSACFNLSDPSGMRPLGEDEWKQKTAWYFGDCKAGLKGLPSMILEFHLIISLLALRPFCLLNLECLSDVCYHDIGSSLEMSSQHEELAKLNAMILTLLKLDSTYNNFGCLIVVSSWNLWPTSQRLGSW